MRLSVSDVMIQKEKIIQSALEVFGNYGYKSAKMEDIAAGAQISRSPLYYYHNNKQELFTATVKHTCEELIRVEEEIFSSGENIFDQIQEVLCSCVRVGKYLEPMRVDMYLFDAELKQAREIYQQFSDQLVDIKRKAMIEAQKKGDLKSGCDVDMIIDLIFVFYRGLLAELKMRLKSRNHHDYIAMITKEYAVLLHMRYGV